MYKFTVFIESESFVLPLIVYADNKKDAGTKGIRLFNKTFKNKKRIISVTVRKDSYYFGWYIC